MPCRQRPGRSRPLPKPSVYELWIEAGGDTPGEYDRDRYLSLMREHGYLLKPGDDGYEEAPKGLPCGWPNKISSEEGPRL